MHRVQYLIPKHLDEHRLQKRVAELSGIAARAAESIRSIQDRGDALLFEERRKGKDPATAITDVSAVEIRHVDFQKLTAQKPQACMKLLMAIVTQFGKKVFENKDALKSLLGR